MKAVPVCVLFACLTAGTPASAAGTPDLSGQWLRTGGLWFDPVDGAAAKPGQRLEAQGPNADDIWTGNFDNPVLKSWARDVVRCNSCRPKPGWKSCMSAITR